MREMANKFAPGKQIENGKYQFTHAYPGKDSQIIPPSSGLLMKINKTMQDSIKVIASPLTSSVVSMDVSCFGLVHIFKFCA